MNIYQDFFTFQNSFVGMIQLNYSLNGCGLAMSNVFQPVNPKDIQKGMKIYDYENSKYFTIGPLSEIISVKQVLISRINNNVWPEYTLASVSSSSTSNYPGLSIKHYRDNVPSVLSIVNSTGNNNNDFLHLFYSYNDKQSGVAKKFSYNLDRTDVEVFLDFLSNYSTFLSTYIALAKYENIKNRDQNQVKGNYNNTNSNYGNSNQSNSSYNNSYTPPNNNYNNNSNYNNANKRNYYNGNEQQYQPRQPQNQPQYQPDQTYRQPYQQPTQPTSTSNPQYQQPPQSTPTSNPPQPQYQQPAQQNQTPPPPPINKEQKNNVDVSPDLKSIFD